MKKAQGTSVEDLLGQDWDKKNKPRQRQAEAPPPDEPKPPLALVGTASSRNQAPFEDDSIEIWGCGTTQVYDDVTRIDRLFEMHPRRYWGEKSVGDRMREFDGPIYMQDHYDEIPNSVRYPYDEVKNMFYLTPMKGKLFVTSTITWMILCALYEGYTDLSLFGIHMAHETEYGSQRASCMWALGIVHGWMLEGKPYSLHLAEDSRLFDASYEYGYGEPTEEMNYVKKRNQALAAERNKVEAQRNKLTERIQAIDGAIGETALLYNRLAGFN